MTGEFYRKRVSKLCDLLRGLGWLAICPVTSPLMPPCMLTVSPLSRTT